MAAAANITSLSDRRGFLRGLVRLPLIGGSVSLIGDPVRADVPVTEALLNSYNTWLDQERRWLAWERAGNDAKKFEDVYNVTWFTTDASRFVHNQPQPSTRAALVMSTVGCGWRRHR